MTTIGKRCSKSGNSLIHRSIQDDTLEPRFNRGHVESLRIEPWGTDGLRVRATIGDDVTYEDWGAQIGTEHTYCIEAQNECGSSAMICSTGSVKVAPEPPEDVNATDGEYSNHVITRVNSEINSVHLSLTE